VPVDDISIGNYRGRRALFAAVHDNRVDAMVGEDSSHHTQAVVGSARDDARVHHAADSDRLHWFVHGCDSHR
jgi:hypothetical protein